MTDTTSTIPAAPTPTDVDPTASAPSDAPPAQSAVTFEVLPLSREVRETLAEIGYTHPTPVQIAVWEPATRGKDAVVQARTGTGKTAAFGLPIVDHIVRRSMAQVQVLTLCPTRELALQVATEVERLGKRKNVKIAAVYGGAAMQRQIDQIEAGAQVVVGTPGRVLDHLRRGTLDPKHVRLLVLDESDEMLSMGFEREVTAILDALPKERQTLLFSATLPPDVDRVVKKLRAPEFVTLSGDHVGALEIEHFVYMVAADKTNALMRVIDVENPEGAVVFCNTRDETERLAGALSRHGYDADWLNGDLPQSDREKVMGATREGRLRFLVATDVAARGIDISHLTHVINFDFPMDAESYIHRTGRTGRMGRTGTAVSLITPQDVGALYMLRLTFKIRPIERQVPSEGELRTRAEADLVAMLVEAFGARPVHPDDLSLARRLLTHERCDAIVAGLLRDHLGARPDAQQEATAARRATRVPQAPAPAKVAPAPPARPAVSAPPRPAAPPPVEPAQAQAPKPVAAPVPAPLPRPEPRREEGRARDDRGERRGDRRGADERGPRSRERGDWGGARRSRGEGRPREEVVPVSAAAGTHEGTRDPKSLPTRHADFVTWQPPEEEGDDEPILGGAERRRAQAATLPPVESSPSGFDGRPVSSADAEDDLAEVYVNVGRREGARAVDFQRILTERAGLERENVRRIRVRERNAFVSVRREDLAQAIAAITGSTIAGKLVCAEQARERSEEAVSEPPRRAPEAAPVVLEAPVEGQVPSVEAPAPAPAADEPAASSDEVPTGRRGAE